LTKTSVSAIGAYVFLFFNQIAFFDGFKIKFTRVNIFSAILKYLKKRKTLRRKEKKLTSPIACR
jgi:hypothetical protein